MKKNLISVFILLLCISAFSQNDTLSPKELKTYFNQLKDKDFLEGFWSYSEFGGIYKDDKPLDTFVGFQNRKVALIKNENNFDMYYYNEAKNIYYKSKGDDFIFIENGIYYNYRKIWDLKTTITIENRNSFKVIFQKPNDYEPDEVEIIVYFYTRKNK